MDPNKDGDARPGSSERARRATGDDPGLEGKGSKRFSAQRAGGETQSAGSHAQARTQMRLAGAAFAQKDDVVMLGEIFS